MNTKIRDPARVLDEYLTRVLIKRGENITVGDCTIRVFLEHEETQEPSVMWRINDGDIPEGTILPLKQGCFQVVALRATEPTATLRYAGLVRVGGNSS